MKLSKISLYQYSLPLVKPLKMKGAVQDSREGIIVEIVNKTGEKGFGDAAPFPGLHKESLSDIVGEFKSNSATLPNLNLSGSQDIWQFLNTLPEYSPALRFAFEWACVDLLSTGAKIIPEKLLNTDAIDSIYLNGLLTGSTSEMLHDARQLLAKNYTSIKVKVALRPIEEEINLVLKLNDLFQGKVNIRLDANQVWSFEEAVIFGKAVNSANIEYIEEPCSNAELFEEFYNETGLSYALDETLTNNSFIGLNDFSGLSALILKPSVLGSLSKIKEWVKWADNYKKKVVFSSAFESGIGLRAISNLAAAFGQEGSSHGLDTFNWLKNDVTVPPFAANNNTINLTDQKFQINKNRLKNVYEYSF